MSIETRKRGEVFGHWKIKEEIGRGADGVVFRIVKNKFGFEDESALKIINVFEQEGKKEDYSEKDLAELKKVDEKKRHDALDEVKLMMCLRGTTNIVDYLDSDFDEWSEELCFGTDLLIRMELLQTLSSIQRRKAKEAALFSEEEIIRVGKDICCALMVCHGKDIIHRDIKPANIYCNNDGIYKLGDFGIARIVDAAKPNDRTVGSGSKPYMAPEQYWRDNYDSRVDIYTLGLVLYELGNENRLPFASGMHATQANILDRLKWKNPLPAPRSVGKALGDVILKACAYKPEERFQTAQEFLDALNALTDAGHVTAAGGGGFYKEKTAAAPTENDMYRTVAAGVQSQPGNDIYATTAAGSQAQPGNDIYATTAAGSQSQQENDIYATTAAGSQPQPQQAAASQPTDTYDAKAENDLSQNAAWMAMAVDADKQNTFTDSYMKVRERNREYVKAAEHFRETAEQGYAPAQNELGACYYYGRGVPRDYTEAAVWYRKAAEQGYAPAQYNLGFCYEKRKGVKLSYAEAAVWYRKAAEQGNAQAQNNLGICYENGRGVNQDYTQAAAWYRKAAEQGHALAQNSLGVCYAKGRGVKQDYAQAAAWYRKAAGQGNALAQNNLGVYYEKGRGVKQDYAQAAAWYRKAAEQGYAYAQYNLGVCYEKGRGVPQAYTEAAAWYGDAARQGYAPAQEAEARMLQELQTDFSDIFSDIFGGER